MTLAADRTSQTRSLGVERVLELDPELGANLSPDSRRDAELRVVAPMFELPSGPWTLERAVTEPGALGVLIVDGLAGAHIGTAERSFLELLGRDDLLQPWVTLGADSSTPTEVHWEILKPTRVLVLGREAATVIGEFPELIAALMTRLVQRSRRLAFQLATQGVVRVEDRLSLLLWHFADRWGRVTPEGVVVELAVTHQQLAEVAGAQRPSLTSAIGALESQGRLMRRPEHEWLLLGEPPKLYRKLRREAGLSVS
jgi:hypothetical protein